MRAAGEAIVTVVCASLASGCGSVCNVASGNADRPYGGVERDIAFLSEKRDTPLGSNVSNGGGRSSCWHSSAGK
jgi:hypothetical protein